MGVSYATADDLADRWRPLSTEEQARAVVLLSDAGVRIRVACPDVDARIAALTLDPEVPLIVSVDMVRRAMMSPVNQPAVSNSQTTVGPFQQGLTYANPTADLYLTKAERKLLGCSSQRASFVDLAPNATSPLYLDDEAELLSGEWWS